MAIGLAFIYIPLLVIVIYAFNASKILEWPPPGLTFEWFPKAIENEPAREAFLTSVKAALAATAIALVLGTLASLAVVAPPLLRPRDDLLPRDPADRAAGDRHRRRTQQHLHPGARDRPQPLHGDRRPRHLLHRRRLQQRRSPGCDGSRPLRGGLGRPRRPHLADVPLRHPAEHASRSAPARCSPSRSPSTRSSSPPSRSAPAKKRCRSGSSRTSSGPRTADRQRGRRDRRPDLDHPRLPRPPPHPRGRRRRRPARGGGGQVREGEHIDGSDQRRDRSATAMP